MMQIFDFNSAKRFVALGIVCGLMSCNVVRGNKAQLSDDPPGGAVANGPKIEQVRPDIRDQIEAEYQSKQKLFKRLAEIDAEAQRDWGEHYELIKTVLGFIQGRIEGKKGPALPILLAGWPGTVKTFLMEWLVDQLGVGDRYFFDQAHANTTMFPLDKLEKSLKTPRRRSADGSVSMSDYISFVFIDEAQNIDSTPFSK